MYGGDKGLKGANQIYYHTMQNHKAQIEKYTIVDIVLPIKKNKKKLKDDFNTLCEFNLVS